MSIQPGSSKLAGRHSVPEIQKKQKSQIKKILLQLLNYQGALSVGYHRQYSFYRRRLFTAYRYIKGKRLPKNKMEDANLIQRITPKIQAHMLSNQSARANMGADYEFDTLRINPEFKQKIERLKKEGRFKVCIFDDYMTHGNTFNAVRNLLKYLGADKIIFVSLGNFSRPFKKKDYKITGNVFDSGYNYELLQSTQQYLTYDEDAKDEIDELYNIFNS